MTAKTALLGLVVVCLWLPPTVVSSHTYHSHSRALLLQGNTNKAKPPTAASSGNTNGKNKKVITSAGCGAKDPTEDDLKNRDGRVEKFKKENPSMAKRNNCNGPRARNKDAGKGNGNGGNKNAGCQQPQSVSEPDSMSESATDVADTGTHRRMLLADVFNPYADPEVIPVNVHIIFAIINGSTVGNYSSSVIQDQIKVLNSTFAPHGFQFYLNSTDRTLNNTAYYWSSSKETNITRSMKDRLYKGNSTSLNLYVAELPGNLGGYSTLPWFCKAYPRQDGVVIHGATMPGVNLGGIYEYYNLGFIAVHETGHWLGLMHTFYKSDSDPVCCNSATCGDRVADTPAQAEPTAGCPSDYDVDQDTCPNDPGIDPMNNYMDYSDDSCKDSFTPGQMALAWDNYVAFRSHGY